MSLLSVLEVPLFVSKQTMHEKVSLIFERDPLIIEPPSKRQKFETEGTGNKINVPAQLANDLPSKQSPLAYVQTVLHSGENQLDCRQKFDFLVVLDFEATCDDKKLNPNFAPQEIIEFPACLLNTKTLEVEDEFQLYIKPTVEPILTDFCTYLTGITQVDVENGLLLSDGLISFEAWLIKHKLLSSSGS